MCGTLSMARGLAPTMDTQELCGVWTVTVSFLKKYFVLSQANKMADLVFSCQCRVFRGCHTCWTP